jgi:hypothetical protein
MPASDRGLGGFATAEHAVAGRVAFDLTLRY